MAMDSRGKSRDGAVTDVGGKQRRPTGGQVIRTASAIDVPRRRSRRIKTLYDVLGVRPDANEESIERAFREASKAYHPDRHGGDAEATSLFKDITAAAAILRDPGQRAAYDLKLRRDRRRRREWAAAAILCMTATAIITVDLLSGRLVILIGPPRTVSAAAPPVAAAEPPTLGAQQSLALAAQAAQPREADVATGPGVDPGAVQKPDTFVTASESAVAPTASTEPSPPHLDASEIASLLKRGAELMANGSIAAARQLFQPAAEAGNPAAALALAETYDPSVLEKLGAKAITPNIALAQQWYEKARALSSTAAR
jgi:TPR repeat protein